MKYLLAGLLVGWLLILAVSCSQQSSTTTTTSSTTTTTFMTDIVARSDFISMVTMVDYPALTVVEGYWDNAGDGNYTILAETYTAIASTGANYVAFTDNPWYLAYEPLPIVTTEADSQRLLTTTEVTKAVNMAHDQGLQFCYIIGSLGVAQSLVDAGFSDNPYDYVGTKTETFEAWWDGWFTAWQSLLVEKAQLAESIGIDMLGIGYSLSYATESFNDTRWQNLITAIRTRYAGPIIYFELGDPSGDVPGFAIDLDYIGLDTIAIATTTEPTVTEMIASFEAFFDAIPSTSNVVLMLSYASIDGAARGEAAPDIGETPAVTEDFREQADIYEAFFWAITDEAWVKGFESWNFNYVDDFHNYLPDSSVDPYDNLTSSIRNKPAAGIVRKWLNVYDP